MATNKQKAAAKRILENPRLPISQAMKDVGYSENTAVHPKDLTTSKGWNELMEEYLPDDKILETHQQGLEATKVVSARITGKDADSQTDDFIDVPDYPTRLKAVELAYKVKKKTEANTNIQINNFIPLLGGESVNGIPTNDSNK